MRASRSLHSIDLRKVLCAGRQADAAQLIRDVSGDVECLTGSEHQRIERLRIPQAREHLARTLVARRLWLANHLHIAPESIALSNDEAGTPLLQGYAPGEVSFSRSADWCAIAIAKGRRVGIDIEIDRDIDWISMVGFLSAPDEAERIKQGVNEANALAPFYRAWCAKEAVLKLLGTGFATGPKTLLLPDAAFAGAPEFDIDLPRGTARVSVAKIEAITVALATCDA